MNVFLSLYLALLFALLSAQPGHILYGHLVTYVGTVVRITLSSDCLHGTRVAKRRFRLHVLSYGSIVFVRRVLKADTKRKRICLSNGFTSISGRRHRLVSMCRVFSPKNSVQLAWLLRKFVEI